MRISSSGWVVTLSCVSIVLLIYPSDMLKNIVITDDVIAQLPKVLDDMSYTQVAVLVDENTSADCYPLVKDIIPEHSVVEIKSGEINKNIETCNIIWQHLTERAFDRSGLLINLGGGVIGDMGGFCARTYKRGIQFINIPTTLLSQVDASVGGKLGIDFKGLKNHIGMFSEPDSVIIDPVFLKTLSERELRSGFAEVIKHHIIADRVGWKLLKEKSINELDWIKILNHSVSIKDEIVTKDPLEKGARKSLNYGHTLGHAIETYLMLNERGILHGEAIAAGMVAENYIAVEKGLVSTDQSQEMNEYLLKVYGKVSLNQSDISAIVDFTAQDKKNKGKKVLATLPKGIGKVVWDIELSSDEMTDALNFYLNYT